MKKAFTLLAALIVAASALFAQTDSIKTSDLTKQVVVTKKQPTTNTQATTQTQQPQQQQQQQQYAQQQQQPAQQTSSFGLCKTLRGTYITFKGYAPYKSQPEDNNYWPRYGLQIGVGQALSFFTYEGVLEYTQTNIRYPYEKVEEYLNSLQGSIRVGGMMPLQLGKAFMVIPNVKGQLGGAFGFGGYSTFFQAGVIAGLDLGFKLGGKAITLGFAYEYRWYVNGTRTVGVDFMGGQLGIII